MSICITESTVSFESLLDAVKSAYLDDSQKYPWIVGFSGGKDSTFVAHLVFEALLSIRPTFRNRQVYFISNDTLVESPFVTEQVYSQFQLIDNAVNCLNLPIKTVITKPDITQSFWTLLIGKGYPCPNRSMRWCTDRLKIQPTSKFILDNVTQYGSAIIVLGVRKDESATRKQSIEKFDNLSKSYLSPHSTLKGAFVYKPIKDVTTSDVWYFLSNYDPPWGGTHEKLIQMYKNADAGECPLVISKDEAPSCGTNSSRFGCWVCTVVTKDKSLQGFVATGMHKFQYLIDFRDWLQEIRNNPEYRQARRRNGQISFMESGKIIAGPFTLEARKMILSNLLKTEKNYGEKIISQDELNIIYEHWAQDAFQNI